jgi:hypothetical protein
LAPEDNFIGCRGEKSLMYFEKTGGIEQNDLDFHSIVAWLECWLGHRLYWLRFLVAFLSPSR